MVATVLNRVKGDISKESVLNAFHENLCFPSVTARKVCFKASGGHSDKHLTPVLLTLQGMTPLKR